MEKIEINNWDPKLQTTIADSEIEYKEIPSTFNDIKWFVKETKEEIIIEEVKPTEEVKPKKVKKVIKQVIEESESEEEEIIIKKKSNNNNKSLTNDQKLKLVEQTAEERLKESLKNDRLNYLLNQIGAKL